MIFRIGFIVERREEVVFSEESTGSMKFPLKPEE